MTETMGDFRIGRGRGIPGRGFGRDRCVNLVYIHAYIRT